MNTVAIPCSLIPLERRINDVLEKIFLVSCLLSIYQLTLKHSSRIWNSASRRLLRADLHTSARETSSSSCLANSKYSYGRKLNSNLPCTSAGNLTSCDVYEDIIINSKTYAEQNQLESTPRLCPHMNCCYRNRQLTWKPSALTWKTKFAECETKQHDPVHTTGIL